jgi:transposase-like protein
MRSAGVDGHRIFDGTAKRELIERCLEGGTSIAKMAQAYGVNANQLHNWIGLYR